MSRLPFLFILTGIGCFILFHGASLFTLTGWMNEYLRSPSGWFYTHLFVLGWATMLAMGAVYQLVNVILQGQIYSERLGYIHYVFFTLGMSGMLYGFLLGEPYWLAIFAPLTFIGILLFAWNIGITLLRASQWNTITVSAASSIMYLVLTGLSGMAMGVNFVIGAWPELHERLFAAHIWLGTLGWFGLLITGFSYKMLPMFYLAHHYPTRLQGIILILWNAGVLFGASSFLYGGGFWTLWLALCLITVAVILYNIQLIQVKKYRYKRNPGLGIMWSMYGNQAFALLLLSGLFYSLWAPESMLQTKSLVLAGWIYLGGWVSFMILCYASKIIPFLWWTHRYGRQIGKPCTPMMADLLDEKKVSFGLAAIAFSLLILFGGLILDYPLVVSIGGMAYSIASITYMVLISLVFTR